MTPIDRPICLPEGDYIRRIASAVVAGALLASCGWIWLYRADTASWGARLAYSQAEVADRCPVPLEGQVIGTRKDGKPICLPVDNLKLPEVKGK